MMAAEVEAIVVVWTAAAAAAGGSYVAEGAYADEVAVEVVGLVVVAELLACERHGLNQAAVRAPVD